MNQRINPATGYPMSTDKQIKVKKKQCLWLRPFMRKIRMKPELNF